MVVIDSITAFEAAIASLPRYQSHIWAMADYCKRSGITCLLTSELDGAASSLGLGQRQISFIADAAILLRYLEVGGTIKRTITVLKMRGSNHQKAVYELLIEPPRLAVGPPIRPEALPSDDMLAENIGE